MTDRKLGRLPYRYDPRTLQLVRYMDAGTLPKPPPSVNLDHLVPSWPMYLNDSIGDCTCAEVGHHVQAFTAACGAEVTVTDAEVLGLYERVSGYDPTTGANDNGAVVLDVLRAWRKIGLAGHKALAFAEVETDHHVLVEDAIYLLGGLSIGVALPDAAKDMGTRWHVPHGAVGAAPASWGRHCVYALDYDRHGVIVVSWGELIHVTWGFWNRYVEEAWAVLSPDWFQQGHSPQGLDLAALQADLAQLGKVA